MKLIVSVFKTKKTQTFVNILIVTCTCWGNPVLKDRQIHECEQILLFYKIF